MNSFRSLTQAFTLKLLAGCFLLLLVGPASGLPVPINYDRSKTREQFRKHFVEVDPLRDLDEATDPSLRFIRMAACVIELNDILGKLSGVTPHTYGFITREGNITMKGITVESIEEPAEKERFTREYDQCVLNGECGDAAFQYRAKLFKKLSKMVDESEKGAAGRHYKILYHALIEQVKAG